MNFPKNQYCDLQKVFVNKYPGILRRLIAFEKEINEKNLYISVSYGGDFETYFSYRLLGNNEISPSILKKIEDELDYLTSHTCYKCGRHTSDKFNIIENCFINLCDICNAETFVGIEKARALATINYNAQKKGQIANIPEYRVRLINKNNKYFFDKLSNLYYKNGDFYISNDIASNEKVRYAGIYLGVRDKNNERIYDGDVVFAQGMKEERHIQFWGMIFEHSDEQKKIFGKYGILHDANSFPSRLDWASEFEVVGNTFEDPNFPFERLHEFKYYLPYDSSFFIKRINSIQNHIKY